MSQSLYLPRAHHNARIISVGGLSHKSPINSITNFLVSPVQSPHEKVSVTAVVVPKVTCYLQMTDSTGKVHISLVMAKTKVALIKRLTIPQLELCGEHLLARVLSHVKQVLEISSSEIFAWTDSTIVLDWLKGNPRRFTQFVGNRVSVIMSLIPPERWSHVNGVENPADCIQRSVSS